MDQPGLNKKYYPKFIKKFENPKKLDILPKFESNSINEYPILKSDEFQLNRQIF